MPEFTTNLAVLVAINAYGDGIPSLATPADDARELAELLDRDFGYAVRPLYEQAATKQGLLDLLRKTLPEELDADSRLIFYFAGHGVARDNAEMDGPEGFLLTADARRDAGSFLPMRDVYEALMALPCRHLLVILDCCFAGSFRWAAGRVLTPPQLSIYDERYQYFLNHRAAQVLTSAAHNQRALDTPAGQVIGTRGQAGVHSPFAAQLLAGLGGAADQYPPPAGDGVITLAELYAYLQSSIDSLQTPRCWPLPGHGAGEFVFRSPSRPLQLPKAAELIELDPQRDPYRALEPYDTAHAGLFFGRDEVVRQLAQGVAGSPLTVVLGPSGSGKTSLVAAGLLPRLGQDPEQRWILPAPVRPGATPLAALHKRLSAELPDLPLDLPTLRRDPTALARGLDTWLRAQAPEPADAPHLLLVIDQLEELHTQVPAAETRDRFLNCLQAILRLGNDHLHLVATLRSDFEAPFADHPGWQETWKHSRFLLRPMTQDELRQVIQRPAEARVLFFEPAELVEELINEVVQMPGALPQLSFTLSSMYRAYLGSGRNDRTLSSAELEEVEGVQGAVRNRAEAVCSGFDAETQETLRHVLLRMISLQGGEWTRRRVEHSELKYADPGEDDRAAKVLRRLVDERLVVAGTNPDGEPYLELAHDSLIVSWDRLKQWIDACIWQAPKDQLSLQDSVSRASRRWHDDQGPVWWNEPQLFQLRILGTWRPWLTARELDFVQASLRVRRRLQLGTALFTILLLMASLWAAVTFYEQNHRNLQLRFAALTQRLTEEVPRQLDQANPNRDPQRALLLARQAANTAPRSGTDQVARVHAALRATLDRALPAGSVILPAQDFPPVELAFRPGASTLAFGLGPRVGLLDTASGSLRFLDHQAEVSALTFDASGRGLAVGTRLGTICLHNLEATGGAGTCLPAPASGFEVGDLVFLGDDHRLVAAFRSADGRGALGSAEGRWQEDRQPTLSNFAWWPQPSPVWALATDSADNLYATVGESEKLWRWAGGSLGTQPTVGPGDQLPVPVRSLHIRPDGKLLVGLSTQRELVFWRPHRALSQPLVFPADDITALTFNPEDSYVVTAGLQTLTWRGPDAYLDLPHGRSSLCRGSANSLAVSDDARLLAVSCDNSIFLWQKPESGWSTLSSASRLPLPGPESGRDHQGQLLAFDPEDPTRLAAANPDGTIAIWQFDPPDLPGEGLPPHLVRTLDRSSCFPLGNLATYLALPETVSGPSVTQLFWHQGELVVVSSGGEIWMSHAGATEAPCDSTPLGGTPCMVALAPDGNWLAEITSVSEVPLLSITRRDDPNIGWALDGTYSATGCSGGIAFHPQHLELVGGTGRQLHRWKPNPAKPNQEWLATLLLETDDPISAVRFSPNGEWLAVASGRSGAGGQIRLRQSTATDRPNTVLSYPEASVETLAFSGDSQLLTAGGSDGSVRVWKLQDPEQPPIVYAADEATLPVWAPEIERQARADLLLLADVVSDGPRGEDLSGAVPSAPKTGLYTPSLSADGKRLAVTAATGTVLLFPLDLQLLEQAACRLASANLSWQDWTRFVGTEEPYELTCPELGVHPSVLQEADRQVEVGNLQAARAIYRQIATAKEQASAKAPLDGERRVRALLQRQELLSHIQSEPIHLRQALASYAQVQQSIAEHRLSPISLQETLRLCRWSALLVDPTAALPVCDDAVARFPEHGMTYDSRGIARALTGQHQLAAEDFERSRNELHNTDWRLQHQAWIERLQQGHNPLTPAVRARIIREEIIGSAP